VRRVSDIERRSTKNHFFEGFGDWIGLDGDFLGGPSGEGSMGVAGTTGVGVIISPTTKTPSLGAVRS